MANKLEVGLSITTADERIRQLFEPCAPPISERIKALGDLHVIGIRTFAMIAPMLPLEQKDLVKCFKERWIAF